MTHNTLSTYFNSSRQFRKKTPLLTIYMNTSAMRTVDDTQIYINSEDNPEARREATDKLQRCIADICEWMEMNALKLNEEKTEYIIFSRNKTHVHDAIKAGNNDAAAQDTVKILGVT